ncbi:MAG: sigma-70 family RNA polymerase sigma factor [Deltaproteobacteria bacterium]|nr:MAG: sigma-70 family RNA polymerase sigma factor [Deltaproteobacteria bacterium]
MIDVISRGSGQRVPDSGGPTQDPPQSGAPSPGAPVTDLAEPAPAALAEPRTRVSATLTDDAHLIAACRRGEARAMEMLYHQYKRRVFGMAHRIVGGSDAEEVAQEVFVRVFRGLAAFRGDSALSTWIYRLTVNAALSHLARRGRRHEVGDEGLTELPAPAVIERDSALAARIETALTQLPAGYRAILVLHDVEGLSHEECAAILECRIGTCKSQLHKARARMRELLGPGLDERSSPKP